MLVGRKGHHGMKNMISNILKGIGIALGVILLTLGGFMGVENVQAPGTINVPILFFSVSAILIGALFLYLSLRKNRFT